MKNIMLGQKTLNATKSYTYLGHIITDNYDEAEIKAKEGCLYGRSNILLMKFYFCSEGVKDRLFSSYCSNSYLCSLFENEQPDEQAGFRRGRGTADMLCCIQNVIEKTLLMSERTFIVFIDYSKAFDSVSHIQMFNLLNDMGFPRHIVALIQALYEKQSAIVRWNGSHTKPFFIEKGVRQGCILSPLLFCAYTEQVMREAEITESGAVIGGRLISNLL